MVGFRVVLAGVVAATIGCGDDDGKPPPPPVEAVLGGLDVAVFPSPARIEIRAGDVVVFDGLPGGPVDDDADAPHVAAAMRTAEVDIDFAFGMFRFEPRPSPPWSGVARFGDVRVDGAAIRFTLLDAGGNSVGTGAIAEAGDGELTIDFDAAGEVNRVSTALRCGADEHFLGFGGQSFDVDHRGQTVPIWVSEDGVQKSADDFYDFGVWFIQGRRHTTHTPMPMYLSSRGYILVADTPRFSSFAMCSEDDGVVRVEAWDDALPLRLFYGPTPAEAIERFTAWVGRPALPPRFAFAPWLDAIFGEDNVRRVAQELRAQGIAVSAIWTEDWRGGGDTDTGYALEEDWRVDRALYPNFEALADELHDDGYKLLVYHNTFIDAEADIRAEAVAGGFAIRDDTGGVYDFDGITFSPTSLVDLSNPDAVAWAKGVIREGLDLGADGYMADFAEWLPHDAVLASGEDAMTAHNQYPVEWARLNQELLADMFEEDGVDRLFFVRAAFMGSQPLVSVVWAGDQQTDFSDGDGFPSVIPIGIGLGVAGFPYFGHDIAGYMSLYTEPADKELFFRWVTLGALSPVMRTHHGRSAPANWSWESDAESIAHMRRWSRFHMQLLPYLYGLAEQSAATGLPMFRPLALDYPGFEPGWTRTDQFMLGDRIVVAPAVTRGATSREVALPPGTFYPLLGGPAVSGTFTADAPIREIPAFVPAGTVLVLLPDGVDTVVDAAPTSAAVSLADVGDDREVWVYPGGSSSWREVGGLAYAWSGDALTSRPTDATFDGASATVIPGPTYVDISVTGPGALSVGGATLTVDGGAPDRAVTVRVFDP